MRIIYVLGILLFASSAAKAQITRASLQASGLTCAMCAKSVYKGLESLPFVDKIDTDLEKSVFLISFKPGIPVDADQVRKKVEDAGFSVAGLALTAHFSQQDLKKDQHIRIDGATYHFIGTEEQVLNGEHQVKVIEKNFLAPKEFKKYAQVSTMDCYKTGLAGDCCAKDGITASTRVYHVTL